MPDRFELQSMDSLHSRFMRVVITMMIKVVEQVMGWPWGAMSAHLPRAIAVDNCMRARITFCDAREA